MRQIRIEEVYAPSDTPLGKVWESFRTLNQGFDWQNGHKANAGIERVCLQGRGQTSCIFEEVIPYECITLHRRS